MLKNEIKNMNIIINDDIIGNIFVKKFSVVSDQLAMALDELKNFSICNDNLRKFELIINC